MGALSDLHKTNKSDEWYTPDDTVRKLVPFIDRAEFNRVLCPFDCKDSAFVRILTEEGFDVTYGDILHTGDDFFIAWDLDDYDIVISNPPFSMRGKILETLLEKRVPFILLLNPDGIVDHKGRYTLLSNHAYHMTMLLPRGRVNYIDATTGKQNAVPFYSAFFASDVGLPQVVFMEE